MFEMPPGGPWADETHYREDMITEWIGGSDAIPADVIALWIAEAAQRGAATRAERAEPDAKPPAYVAPPDALALSYEQSAAMLGYSRDHFERYVVPDLRVIVKGRRKTVPRTELVRWVEDNAARALRGA